MKEENNCQVNQHSADLIDFIIPKEQRCSSPISEGVAVLINHHQFDMIKCDVRCECYLVTASKLYSANNTLDSPSTCISAGCVFRCHGMSNFFLASNYKHRCHLSAWCFPASRVVLISSQKASPPVLAWTRFRETDRERRASSM